MGEQRERPDRPERNERNDRHGSGGRKAVPAEQTNAENFYYRSRCSPRLPW